MENSFSEQQEQNNLSPYQQWKKFADPDILVCKQGHLLLQKNNGIPVCVMPSTYMKLVDRGYGDYDSSIMTKRPEMMNMLMHHMVSDKKVTYHWHEMLQLNPSMMRQTMDNWTSQMKDDPQLLKNMLGPMTSDANLRQKMIETMKNHPQMENYLKQSSVWMDSVHQSPTGSNGMKDGANKNMCSIKSENSSMGCEMMNHGDTGMNCPICEKMKRDSCSWCPEYQMHQGHGGHTEGHSMMHVNSTRIMNMMHHIWINSGMSEDVHNIMVRDPSHMAQMADQLMEPMLNAVMDDKVLREQMMELMLEHQEFMNTIRHSNPSVQGH